MSFLDDVSGYLDQANKTVGQVGQVSQQVQRLISGRAGTATPPTVDDTLHGLSFAPWVVVGIIGLVVLAVATSARR